MPNLHIEFTHNFHTCFRFSYFFQRKSISLFVFLLYFIVFPLSAAPFCCCVASAAGRGAGVAAAADVAAADDDFSKGLKKNYF